VATGETGFDDVTCDLTSAFFQQVMNEDSDRAARRHDYLAEPTKQNSAGAAIG
jgi:hypothetical protein